MTARFTTRHPFDTDVDISSIAFWSGGFDEREQAFRRLRQEAPVSWHPQLETPGLPRRLREAGFWAVTTAADVAYVSRHHELFSSELGQVSLRPTPLSIDRNMLVTDPPEHSRLRRVVSAAFTARSTARLEQSIARRARQIVLRAAAQAEFDFVQAVAAQLPLRTLADLLGVPSSEQDRFVAVADGYASTGISTTDLAEPAFLALARSRTAYLRDLTMELVAMRRRAPSEDLLSRLATADVDGRPFSDEEILSTVLLLIVAGDDTTKQAITLSMIALDRFPAERAWLAEDFDARFDGAFDELMRFSSPVLTFARTATQDLDLGGKRISAGDKVALFYCSANRDEQLFDDPDRLDLARTSNRHVAFGGGGVHFCLGNAIARQQLKALFRELLQRLPGIELGAPRYRFSEFSQAVDALPAKRGPR